MKIRKSTQSERKEILNIHSQAFGKDKGPVIAKLVNDLLADETALPILSLVAVDNDNIIGHILFTKVVVKSEVQGQVLKYNNYYISRPDPVASHCRWYMTPRCVSF